MQLISRGCRQAKIGPTSRQVVFLHEAEDSHDDIRSALHDAIKAELPTGTGYWVWVVEVWDDKFAYEYETPDGAKTFMRDYSVDAEGMAELGNPIEVVMETEFVPVGDARKPVAESLAVPSFAGQIIPLIESSIRPDGTVPIKLIEPGWGASAYYGADILERDGPAVFPKGTHMGWDHMTEAEFDEQPEGELNNFAAVLESDARWEPNHPKGPGLYADAKVFETFADKLDEMAPHIGTSICTDGVVEADRKGKVLEGEREGRTGPILQELLKTKFTSVDFVTRPGAGGAVLQLFESLRPKKKDVTPMPDTELKEAQDLLKVANEKIEKLEEGGVTSEADATELARLREAELMDKATTIVTETLKDIEMPDVTRERVIREASKNPPVKDGELDTEALEKSAQEAATAEAEYRESLGVGDVHGMGGNGGDTDRKLMEAAVRRAHRDWSDEKVADFCDV